MNNLTVKFINNVFEKQKYNILDFYLQNIFNINKSEELDLLDFIIITYQQITNKEIKLKIKKKKEKIAIIRKICKNFNIKGWENTKKLLIFNLLDDIIKFLKDLNLIEIKWQI